MEWNKRAKTRIRRAVRKVEGLPLDVSGDPNRTPRSRDELILVRLTSRQEGPPVKFGWTEVRRLENGTYEDVEIDDDGNKRVGTETDNPAVYLETDDDRCTVNDIVTLKRIPVKQPTDEDEPDAPLWEQQWVIQIQRGSKGQYQGMHYLNVTDSQMGHDFPFSHAIQEE